MILKNAVNAKAERDEAVIHLRVTLRKLDWLTRENQLVVSMGRAQEQYERAIEKHVAFCAEQGENPFAGAHGYWQIVLGDLYSRSLGRAEKKLKAIRVANEPHENSDASKLADAKLEWSIAECRLKVDIDGLIMALESEQIGVESHKSLEKARDQLEKDMGSVHWKALDIARF